MFVNLAEFDFGQPFIRIGANNDQIWQLWNVRTDSNVTWFHFLWTSYNDGGGGQIVTRCDFLDAIWVILSNGRTDSNLT